MKHQRNRQHRLEGIIGGILAALSILLLAWLVHDCKAPIEPMGHCARSVSGVYCETSCDC